jgi:EpsG family
MGWYYILYIFVLLGGMIPLVTPPRWWRALFTTFAFLLFVGLVLFIGFRAPGVDRDYYNYLDWFQRVSDGPVGLIDLAKDPAFVLISLLVAAIHIGYTGVALIFAATSVGAVILLAIRSSELEWVPLFVYLQFCRFFVPQEMTQIRVGVAIPLLSLGILMALQKRRTLAWFLLGLAVSFHFAVLLALPVFLIAMYWKVPSRFWLLALIPLAFAGFLALHQLMAYLAQLSRVSEYLTGNYEVSGISLLSVYFLSRLSVLLFIVSCYWHRISEQDRLVVYCVGVGMMFQVALASNDALALRAAEVFGMFDIMMFLIPLRMTLGIQKWTYVAVLLFLGGLFFNSGLKIINPYEIGERVLHI